MRLSKFCRHKSDKVRFLVCLLFSVLIGHGNGNSDGDNAGDGAVRLSKFFRHTSHKARILQSFFLFDVHGCCGLIIVIEMEHYVHGNMFIISCKI